MAEHKMAERMIEDRAFVDFVEDELKTIESKDGRFIMVTSHSSEQVNRDNMRVKVHIEADLDILLPHDEKYDRDDRFVVTSAISQCRNLINPPMAFQPNMSIA